MYFEKAHNTEIEKKNPKHIIKSRPIISAKIHIKTEQLNQTNKPTSWWWLMVKLSTIPQTIKQVKYIVGL